MKFDIAIRKLFTTYFEFCWETFKHLNVYASILNLVKCDYYCTLSENFVVIYLQITREVLTYVKLGAMSGAQIAIVLPAQINK